MTDNTELKGFYLHGGKKVEIASLTPEAYERPTSMLTGELLSTGTTQPRG